MEQFMMYAKAKLFKDEDMAEKIMQAKTPGAAKKCGRLVRGFDEKIWNMHKREIVYVGCKEKFTQNPEILNKLLSTGNSILAEATRYDRIWGIGMNSTDIGVTNPKNWKGQNLLGYILTQVKMNIKFMEDDKEIYENLYFLSNQ